MNCQITIRGNGIGRYGHPKNDRTGPLSEFLVDNVVLLRQISKHLKQCNKCTVEEVLQIYLKRLNPGKSFNGCVSISLASKALVFENIARRKEETLTPGLVNEFLWRSPPASAFHEFSDRLSIIDKYNCLNLYKNSSYWPNCVPDDISESDKYLVELVDSGVSGELSNEEIEKLVQICEVQQS